MEEIHKIIITSFIKERDMIANFILWRDYSEWCEDFKRLRYLDNILLSIIYDSKKYSNYLHNISDYNTIESKRKTEAIAFLTANDMDTPNNRALINAVKFTPDAIEIGWVRWWYNNLQASDVGMNYSTDTNEQQKNYEEAHVFKWEWKFAQEDYFTRKAIDTLPANKKAKIPTYKDMRKTLAAIPWWPVGQAVPTSESSTSRTKWSAKILSILLWIQMSSYRRAGERDNTNAFGALWSASPLVSVTSNAWAFRRGSSEGRLGLYDERSAFPCRPLA